MKRLLVPFVLLGALISSMVVAGDDGLDSLRQHSLEQQLPAERMKDYPKDNKGLGLSYVHQPPLIPHSIRNYQVDKNSNKCLSCHSFKNHKRYNATRISVSHFTDRDGNVRTDVSPRRYFCQQCHVPQVQSETLIENDFQPAGALKP